MGEIAIQILLVEDNPGDARLLQEAIKDAEGFFAYKLTHVERLGEAIQRVQNRDFDVVLLDLTLPDSNGIDTVRRMTAAAPDTPVLVLTGIDDEVVGTNLVRAGAQDYLVKGRTDRRLLTRAIRYAIARKRMEAELFEQRNRLTAIIESAMDAIITIDEQQQVVLFNPAAERMFNCKAAQVLGQTLDRFIPEQFRQSHREQIRHFNHTGVTARAMGHLQTLYGLRSDGEKFPLEASISRVEVDGKMLLSVILRDITAQKQAEDELKAAKNSAEQAKAIAEAANDAKDQFLAVLSHELRTPLAPVLAATEMLEADATLSADQRDTVQMMHRNVELEARLIDDLLDLTRIVRNKLELHFAVVDLHDTIAQVIEICRNDIAAKQLTIGIDLSAQGHLVKADPARLQQIVWNLLKNAIKFTPLSGHIGFRTSNSHAGRVTLEVTDTGIGIDAEVLPRIFNAFEQGGRQITRKFGGLGLGLAVSKGLVEMHGGVISATSAGHDQGAVLTVELPISGSSKPVTDQAKNTSPRQLSCSLLLVEDHADTRRVMCRLLSALGCRVKTASTVAEALQIADQDKFDLLISDIGLPDGSGIELMRTLRGRGLDLPGIALSGYGQEEDIAQSRKAGFIVHIVKPVSFPQLERAIAQVVAGGGTAD